MIRGFASEVASMGVALLALPLLGAEEPDFLLEDPTNEVAVISPVTTNGLNLSVPSISLANGVSTTSVPSLSALPTSDTIQPQDISNISRISQETGIPYEVVKNVYKMALAKGIGVDVVPDIAKISQDSSISAAVLVDIYAMMLQDNITGETISEVVKASLANGIPMDVLDRVVKLSLSNPNKPSRFDTVRGALFSNLWMVQMQGKEAERRGENTDELYKKYWNIVYRAIMQGK